MIRFMVIAAAISLASISRAADDNSRLMHAIAVVESGIDHSAVGDHGKARGAWQLTEPAWKDVSAILKKRGASTVVPWRIGAHMPHIAMVFASNYISLTIERLERALGRRPMAKEIYAAYNLGFEGFRKRKFNFDRCPRKTRATAKRLEQYL